jgi:GNAT superfamily N-acetyltransferase
MFRDMGDISEEEVNPLRNASIPWLRKMIAAQAYFGWLVVCGSEIVSGGGLQIRQVGPVPGCFRIGRWGHIGNIYTVPAHRRKGLARPVLRTILN